MTIVKPFSDAQYELMMRQMGTSYTVADGWTIGWTGNGWQVFYRAIDAYYRLNLPNTTYGIQILSSFKRAWQWIEELTVDEIHKITVESVAGTEKSSG